jgi:hypothetical protein
VSTINKISEMYREEMRKLDVGNVVGKKNDMEDYI